MKVFITGFLSLVFFQVSLSQNLAAYYDYRSYFYVFDNGANQQAEYLPVKSYKVGGNAVAYVDNSDNFKVFYAGKSYPLADVAPTAYSATDDLVVYNIDKLLSVFDNGTATKMPGWATSFVSGDSIVGYFDDNGGLYKVYYGGVVNPLPDVIDDNSISTFIAGDNLLAYFNADGNFRAFFHNKVYDLGTNHVSKYQAGSSTIAFMDEYSQTFKVFYNGVVATMENQPPKSMQCGDDLIAYIDATGSFKIFYKGSLITVMTYEPGFYSTVDNVVAFGTDNVDFNVFYKGNVYKLETNTPVNYQLDYNSVAYIDPYGYLKLFSDGKTKQVTSLKITDYTLTKNVLMYKTAMFDYHFYLNGTEY